jgi:hypothetical protein
MNTRLLAGILCASTFLGVLGLFLISSHSAPAVNNSANEVPADNAPRTGRSTFTKIMIPQPTGDADVDQANVAKAMDEARLVQQNNAQRAAARQRAEESVWKGTKLGVKTTETNQDTIALHQTVCKAFDADPPAPAERTAAIQKVMSGSPQLKWNGYYGTVESVTPNEDGWKAVIKVSPRLPGVWFTPFRVIEVWQIGKDGRLQNLSCKPDPEAGHILMR